MPKGETSLVMRARHDPNEIITTQGKSFASVHPRSSKTLYAVYSKLAPVLRHSGEDGNTVLMVVARHPKQPPFAIQFLLEKGAERSSANYQDCTALMIAAKLNHNLVVNSLLQSRKSYYVEKIEEMRSALEMATQSGHAEILRTLLEFSQENIISNHLYLVFNLRQVEEANNHRHIAALKEECGADFAPLT
ncbi:uncharacterized protein RSE6_13049 [Rhynchosporium secalis]|uniref:Uncharacterized protein n=1 Tax=Rhynchosporium secalis TaxID=38038 RepID=A0A1E1MRW9_RHYSE|nr:uncharacterized protein RSE6_13049 [Rhynchosporium secalis]